MQFSTGLEINLRTSAWTFLLGSASKRPLDRGYGYFYVRLYWTGFGLNANIVEEYVLLSAVMHVVIALKRTYDITSGYAPRPLLSTCCSEKERSFLFLRASLENALGRTRNKRHQSAARLF